MSLARWVVWLNALVFLLFGLAASIAPASISLLTLDAAPASPAALIDTRATYGGMMMAVGVALAMMARDRELIRMGLLSVIALMGLMALTRSIGIVVDGSATPMMWLYLAAEILSLALAVFALRGLPSKLAT